MSNQENVREIADEGPCPYCGDSGHIEFVSGNIWTGENISTRREICHCPCGDDVRREAAVRAHLLSEQEG